MSDLRPIVANVRVATPLTFVVAPPIVAPATGVPVDPSMTVTVTGLFLFTTVADGVASRKWMALKASNAQRIC